MMMYKLTTYELVIFDKDNTLVRPKHGMFSSYRNQEIIPEMKEAINLYLETCEELGQENTELMIATNQGGVAYPLANPDHPRYKDLGGLVDELLECNKLYGDIFTTMFAAIGYPKLNNNWLLEISNVEGNPCIELTNYDVSYSTFRKPGSGMIKRAKWSAPIAHEDQKDILFLGDSEEDKEAASNAKVDYKTPQEFIQWTKDIWEENFSCQNSSYWAIGEND